MMDARQEALLNGAIDDALTDNERGELKRLLASSAEARTRLEDLERLNHLLDDLGQAEPPAALVRDVMSSLALRRGQRGTVVPMTRGGWIARRAMLGLAAAAAVFLVIFTTVGWPPIGRGTEGTIGAAKRYQKPQISDSDVKLADQAVQEFLQSDIFDRLTKDEAARRLLSDSSSRLALADATALKALTDPDVMAALHDDAVERALSEPGVSSALTKQGLSEAALPKALNRPELARLFASPAFREAMARAEFRLAIAQANFREGLRAPAMAAALQDSAFLGALKSADFERALSSDRALSGR